tara:strand:- start:1313 stop:1459 length:147 start_codon:yes stop_codon:yes gene_type:complete
MIYIKQLKMHFTKDKILKNVFFDVKDCNGKNYKKGTLIQYFKIKKGLK